MECYAKPLVGSICTASVLYLSCLGVPSSATTMASPIVPSSNLEKLTGFSELPEEFYTDPYLEVIKEDSASIYSYIEVMQTFLANLVENTHDLEPDFVKAVDDHFWELI